MTTFRRRRKTEQRNMNIIRILYAALFLTFAWHAPLSAQAAPADRARDSIKVDGRLTINGQILPYTIDECGDTIIMANLEDVSVTSLRKFETREDVYRYRRYKRYALEVYPYAVEAIKIFRQVESLTDDMNPRTRKKYIKQLQKDLKEKFRQPLMGLSKTQGLILFKMIEKELDTPVYELIRELRNGLTATYWQTMGGLYGHNLKEGYIPGEDPILDAVLNDLDISYQVSSN